ncbi:hypothetical protein [Avrilella dinanensis]|uniref:Uncharacterized protein n=1 Tax=Avrilella dinanensis TaxID=2008672 RepID=A0A2M9R7Y3_9FLAO|nr:hypothetical protein [Avrilella dinanensis]PJR04961.1 hypothetical protein CDL10_10715 [Avrilella dinanensis]
MRNKLHFIKQVLETVSFDPNLFAKELKKAKTYLLPYELEQLYKWVNEFVKNKPELSELNLAY